jgi:hyperosmotically inducible protein
MTRFRRDLLLAGVSLSVAGCVLAIRMQAAEQSESKPSSEVEQIARDVHKQIVTLPQYGVFDHIHFAIKGNTVILRGSASRPVLKSSCENVVKKIQGVREVQNEIEVLPLSPSDDRIRALTYARIYGNPSLSRYTNNRGGGRYISPMRRTIGITNDPPIGWHAIHIIVKNGNVRLVGVVDTTTDLAIAEMQANSVPGAFTVDNELIVANEEKK